MAQVAEASTLDPTTGKRARYTLDSGATGDTVICVFEGAREAMVLRGPSGEGPIVFADLMTRLEAQGYLVVPG